MRWNCVKNGKVRSVVQLKYILNVNSSMNEKQTAVQRKLHKAECIGMPYQLAEYKALRGGHLLTLPLHVMTALLKPKIPWRPLPLPLHHVHLIKRYFLAPLTSLSPLHIVSNYFFYNVLLCIQHKFLWSLFFLKFVLQSYPNRRRQQSAL